MKKICSVCNIEKEIQLFYKRKDNIDGYRNNCKDCHNNVTKVSNIKFRSKESSKIKKTEYNKKYWLDNKETLIVLNKKKYDKNRDKYLEDKKRYYKEHKEEILIKNITYTKERLKEDNLFRFKHNIRSLIRKSVEFKGYKKNTKTENIIGLPINDFLNFIESKFECWMNWDNYGLYNGELNYGWDIDHIIPLSSALNEEEIIKLNHYTNLQPLCSKTNRDIKKNKML